MNSKVKEFIEKHISLIENNEFEYLFEKVLNSYLPQFIYQVVNVLESADIHPIPYLTFIPEGYYMLSPIAEYITPENIRRICYEAFYASDLQKLHITSNCYEIESSAFKDCDDLTTVVIDEGLRHIGESAFYACDSLSVVMLPASLESIGMYAFQDCDQLLELHYAGTKDQWQAIRDSNHISNTSYISKIICSDGIINILEI